MTRKQRDKLPPGMTAEGIVAFLNELFVIDPDAMHKLVLTRVSCNEDMCCHPTVMVSGKDKPKLGLLGVINGLFSDGKVICAVMSQDEKQMSGFKILNSEECQ